MNPEHKHFDLCICVLIRRLTPFLPPGNSNKDHNNQPKVADDICAQLCAGERGIIGVMIESNLEAGKQSIFREGCQVLKKGISITDVCIDWQTTDRTLRSLADAVKVRRQGGVAI